MSKRDMVAYEILEKELGMVHWQITYFHDRAVKKLEKLRELCQAFLDEEEEKKNLRQRKLPKVNVQVLKKAL